MPPFIMSIFDSRIEARLISVRKDYLWLPCSQRKTTVFLGLSGSLKGTVRTMLAMTIGIA
jgi:hypothetical protein